MVQNTPNPFLAVSNSFFSEPGDRNWESDFSDCWRSCEGKGGECASDECAGYCCSPDPTKTSLNGDCPQEHCCKFSLTRRLMCIRPRWRQICPFGRLRRDLTRLRTTWIVPKGRAAVFRSLIKAEKFGESNVLAFQKRHECHKFFNFETGLQET